MFCLDKWYFDLVTDAGDAYYLYSMDVGGYFTSLGNNFAGPRPAIVSVEGGKPTLIRRRETYEDLIERDL